MSRRHQIKEELFEILKRNDFVDILDSIRSLPEKQALHGLFSAICFPDEHMRWHAVSAFGVVLDSIAIKELEAARIVMRRLLWSLNEESGGIGWGAPETMAEVMAVNPILFREYVHMLLSYMREDGPELLQEGNYLELPELQRGVVWGIGRLAQVYPESLIEKGAVEDLLPYLSSPDGAVRGLAAWALGVLRCKRASTLLQRLLEDDAPVNIYLHGNIRETTVSALARGSLEQFI